MVIWIPPHDTQTAFVPLLLLCRYTGLPMFILSCRVSSKRLQVPSERRRLFGIRLFPLFARISFLFRVIISLACFTPLCHSDYGYEEVGLQSSSYESGDSGRGFFTSFFFFFFFLFIFFFLYFDSFFCSLST